MRHLLFTFIFALSTSALAQEAKGVDVSAAMSRGAVVCSTPKINLSAKGIVLDDKSAGIKFSYIGGSTFTHKFVAKAMKDGNFTVYGHLASLSSLPKAKSWFEMTEKEQGGSVYHVFKFSPVYRTDGSIVQEKTANGTLQNTIGKINIRCTNLPVIADILPEYSNDEIEKLKLENTPK